MRKLLEAVSNSQQCNRQRDRYVGWSEPLRSLKRSSELIARSRDADCASLLFLLQRPAIPASHSGNRHLKNPQDHRTTFSPMLYRTGFLRSFAEELPGRDFARMRPPVLLRKLSGARPVNELLDYPSEHHSHSGAILCSQSAILLFGWLCSLS